ncbi:MAG: GNAT family N-acetyltransferase [Pseudomonadota bacterium]|nr:GNAT family N-acetyltransferase [Pseudomonadota bacterium]
MSDRLTRRRFAALARSPSAYLLVAHAGRTLLGYVLVLTRRGSRSARLYSLAVAPEAQGIGLGLKLLAEAEAVAQARGAVRLLLEVRTDNEPAVRLYERAGYSQLARQESYYEDGMAALRYGRDFRERSPASMQVPAMGRAA